MISAREESPMHAVIVGVSDPTYAKLCALAAQAQITDHSWLATHLLEQAVQEAPVPGTCQGCGQPFAVAPTPGGQIRYCSDICRQKGYRARKRRWWRSRARRQAGAGGAPDLT